MRDRFCILFILDLKLRVVPKQNLFFFRLVYDFFFNRRKGRWFGRKILAGTVLLLGCVTIMRTNVFFFRDFDGAIVFGMFDLVVEPNFRFEKFANCNHVTVIWKFWRRRSALGRPREDRQRPHFQRLLGTTLSERQAGGPCTGPGGRGHQGPYFYIYRDFNSGCRLSSTRNVRLFLNGISQ